MYVPAENLEEAPFDMEEAPPPFEDNAPDFDFSGFGADGSPIPVDDGDPNDIFE